MGRQWIEGFKELDNIDLDTMLDIHLKGNHYPPVHSSFIPVCKEAIECCNDEDYNKQIKMPNGIVKSAMGIVEGLHLDSFLEEREF